MNFIITYLHNILYIKKERKGKKKKKKGEKSLLSIQPKLPV